MEFIGIAIKTVIVYCLYLILKPIYLICKNRTYGRIPCIKNTARHEIRQFPKAVKTYLDLLTTSLGEAGPVVVTMLVIYFFVNLYMNIFTWADKAGEMTFGPPH